MGADLQVCAFLDLHGCALKCGRMFAWAQEHAPNDKRIQAACTTRRVGANRWASIPEGAQSLVAQRVGGQVGERAALLLVFSERPRWVSLCGGACT